MSQFANLLLMAVSVKIMHIAYRSAIIRNSFDNLLFLSKYANVRVVPAS